MRNLGRRGTVLSAGLVVAIVSAGAAWAWQVASNTGHASAKSAAIKKLTVHAGPDPVTGLYPTGSVNLVVTVDNDNEFPVEITSLAVDRGSINADAAHASRGCVWSSAHPAVTTTNIAYSPAEDVNRTVQPGNHLVLTFADAILMASDAPIACAGAHFDIPVQVTGKTP